MEVSRTSRSLFAEDGAKQLFFRRHGAFALRRNLADENIARCDFSTDIDNTGFVEVLQSLFRNVRNVTGNLFRSEFGVARHHFELVDMDRGENVVAHDAPGQQDRVLVIIAVPGHEGDEHVAAQRQIAKIRRPGHRR